MNKFLKQLLLFFLTISSLLNAFQPANKAELQTAVDLWISDKTAAMGKYGEINTWNISQRMHDGPLSDPSPSFFNDHFENGERSMLDQFIDHGQQNNLMTMGRNIDWNNTSQLSGSWNASDNAWAFNYQTINTYDANNNQTGYLSQSWSNNAWVN